jgi:hypothetical protein
LGQAAPIHAFEGGEGFGIVTPGGNLDLLALSQRIDADERARSIMSRPVNAVIESLHGGMTGSTRRG